MKPCKEYVRNPARPEGCICEGYLAEESIRFCCEYIKESCALFETHKRNEEYQNENTFEGRPISKGEHTTLSNEDMQNGHRYVLFNTAEVEPYEV